MPTTSLAAILFVELYGFGELLGRDEAGALKILGAWRDLAEPLILEHGGELVDATGDELLLVFPSAVGAVQCALHLRLAAASPALVHPQAGACRPRTGIHLGEIWRDEARVYGNGVNVAARIKAEAGPGQILVSEDIFRQVSSKLDLASRALPERRLKNIERSLAIYELGCEPEARQSLPSTSSVPPLPRPPQPPEPPQAPDAPAQFGAGEEARRAVKAAILKGLEDKGLFLEDLPEAGRRKLSLSINFGEDEAGDEDPDGDKTPERPSPGKSPTLALDQARSRVSKGLTSLLGGGLVFLVLGYLYLTSHSTLLGGGALLCGLGPALSGLKNLILGLFELRDWRKDHS
jgi:class 3 adenylate cyclase